MGVILITMMCCAPKQENQVQEVVMEDIEKGFFHNVYFWLKPDITDAQRDAFMQGLESMQAIETLIDYEIMVPAMTPREVVDNSYDVCIVTSFKDSDAHDEYQVHPIHDAFREIAGPVIDSLRIYDSKSM